MASIKIVPDRSATDKRYDEAVTDPDVLAIPKRPTTYFSGISSDNTVRGSIDQQKFARRLPTPLEETLGTSFNEAVNERSLSIMNELSSEYSSYIQDIEKATGRPSGLSNPYNLPTTPSGGALELFTRPDMDPHKTLVENNVA